MITYWNQNATTILTDTAQHAQLVLTSLLIALLIATLLILLCLRHDRLLTGLTYVFSLLYSVPSFAFFALLLPLTGLGDTTATVVLVVYSEYVLLRTFITGLRAIDLSLVEVAYGMGMTSRQVFFKVQLPLATPAIFSGLQVALASTMSIATIAATINAGGLGNLLFEGLQTQQLPPLLWGIIMTVALTLVSIAILRILQHFLRPRFSTK